MIGLNELVIKPTKLCNTRPENLKTRKVSEENIPCFCTFIQKYGCSPVLRV